MKLLVFDVEGTLFGINIRLPGTSVDSTIWQSIAHALGPAAVKEEIESHRKWERGEYRNYMAWMEDTIAIHRKYGLRESLFKDLIARAQYNRGVVEALSRVDRKRYEMVLISGGFRELAARAQLDFDIKHAFAACEYLFDDSGELRSYNLLPCDFAGKLDFIELLLREYGLALDQWVFVGDGLNDVPVARGAPQAIGYRPHPELRKVCQQNLDEFQELIAALATIEGVRNE
jgi:phosphoserine phosphatase